MSITTEPNFDTPRKFMVELTPTGFPVLDPCHPFGETKACSDDPHLGVNR